jgi:hypothetical protein
MSFIKSFVCVAGGHWQRAADMYQSFTGAGKAAEAATTHALLTSLAANNQIDRALQLLQVGEV